MKSPVKISLASLALTSLLLAGCSGGSAEFRYSGRMDTDTLTISSQTVGLIDSLNVSEGDLVHKGQILGSVDDEKFMAQRDQQSAQFSGFDARTKALQAQIQQSQAQLSLDQQTLEKTEKVLAQGGATVQSRDELATKVQVEGKSVASLKANLKLLLSQENELKAQVQQTDLSIHNSKIISPLDGTVLTKYHFSGELAVLGTPLVDLADLSTLFVKIYVPLNKLGAVKLGQNATVFLDGIKQGFRGRVTWISSEASFTPKTILTQETRTTLVFPVKITVENPEGVLKIGLPVEVTLP